ncbi:urea carboxylase-associated family protein [Halalkalicoccus salilacus]|uniref:urea carboxylase-associated family protein n=1 Tax=Halalkalicoccus salilacus TaxID=3117459 RepID=UPI00300EAE82
MHHRIPERSGAAFAVDRGEAFAVTTPEGRQVADLVAFVRDDPDERFSQSYTRDLNGTLRITTGDALYTTAGEPILEITDDDCGVHDLLFGPCTGWMLTDRAHEDGVQNEPGGCRENLALALEAAGVTERVPDTMNVFQKSTVTDQRYFDVRESPAEPGDAVTFEAAKGAIVAVSACSAKGVASGSSLGPIDLRLPAGTTVHERSVRNEVTEE